MKHTVFRREAFLILEAIHMAIMPKNLKFATETCKGFSAAIRTREGLRLAKEIAAFFDRILGLCVEENVVKMRKCKNGKRCR